MNQRERVLAAIKGQPVDHVPSLFSLHFPKEVSAGEAAVEAHISFYKQTGVDVIKIMNENLEPAIGTLGSVQDWDKVLACGLDAPFLTRQIDLIRRILDRAGEGVYSLATIHGVCASTIHPIEAAHGYVESRRLMCESLRSDRQRMLDVHRRVTDTMCQLAQACIRAGADGIYYAALGGEKHFYTDEEFETCIRPFDLQIMQAAREAGGHVFLHICKENLNMERYRGYDQWADVVNWGVYETDYSLEDGRKLFPESTILGGLANRSGVLAEGPEDAIAREVRALVQQFGTRRFILGADCTLPTDIPYSRIAAAVQAAVI